MYDIKINLERDNLFDELGLIRLREAYLRDDEKSPQERFAFVSSTFASNKEHAQRLYEYASKHWLSYATPVLAYGRSKRGLPVSCYLNFIEDTAEGLVDNLSETNWLSMLGGGVGIGFGIRSSDEKSTGVMPHLKMYDSSSLAFRQGKTRRGSYAAYLNINHPDIISFIEMRKPTGDQNMRTLNLHHGVNLSDKFMKIIEKCMIDPDYDDTWELVDPHSKKVITTVSAKYLWQKLLETRMQTGEPYFHYVDESNRKLPKWLKQKGLKINQSNLCSEITLPTDKDRTAVCCLSSLNLEYWDDWSKDPLFLRDVIEMLDNVLTLFIKEAPSEISRAVYSAMQERSVGLGALGFHALLQSKGLPFESAMAVSLNKRMFKHIREKLDIANKELASERGEAPDAKGFGVRLSHLMAIAPNASSSILMGNTSPSIEPFRANAYRQDTLSGSKLNKNRYLDYLIKDEAKTKPEEWYSETWSSIIANEGSVQHLDWMEPYLKDVFKTAMEIDQRWIIQHAADRQKYIDQAQSVNLFFRPDASIAYIHFIHFLAWKMKLKTLYYCRSEKIAKADKVANKIERNIIKELDMKALAAADDSTCVACEG
jgi:ribonucleoside-diphosphate reductase alpha chain